MMLDHATKFAKYSKSINSLIFPASLLLIASRRLSRAARATPGSLDDVLYTSEKLSAQVNSLNTLKEEVMEQAEVKIKYSGYISKEQNVADKIIRLEGTSIPADMNYTKLNSLSNESKEKLNFVKPTTIGQASRISGIKPTDINILLIYLGR